MSMKRRPPSGNVHRVSFHGQGTRGVLTNKAGRLVQFETPAERALLLLLDRDPQVADYSSQPETFAYADRLGRLQTCTLDFIVWRADGTVEICQVLRAESLPRPAVQDREAAIRALCAARSWRYIAHTEVSLPQETELANLLALVRYRPLTCADPAVANAAQTSLQDGPRPFRSLVQQIAGHLMLAEAHVCMALGYLIWHGAVQADLHTLLFTNGAPAADVLIRLAGEEG